MRLHWLFFFSNWYWVRAPTHTDFGDNLVFHGVSCNSLSVSCRLKSLWSAVQLSACQFSTHRHPFSAVSPFLSPLPLQLFATFLWDIFLSRNDYISKIYLNNGLNICSPGFPSWIRNADLVVWRCIFSPLQGSGLYHVFRSTRFHYSYITVITFRCTALQMVPVWLGLGSKTTWLGSGKDRTLG